MSTQQQSKKEQEVYSISGFKDTLASPVFYPVIVVALVLGITSIFGFVQNPLKLKSMVNVIQQKVATNNVVNDSYNAIQPSFVNNSISKSDLSEAQALTVKQMKNNRIQTNYALELFPDIDLSSSEKMPIAENFERIAFNYDVTSQSFWTDLDSSKLETTSEELERKAREFSTFGAPLIIDVQESLPTDFKIQNNSIYAINNKGF